MVTDFIRANCATNPASTVKLADFVAAYQRHYPRDTRSVIEKNLADAGYVTGRIGKVRHVAGITLHGRWVRRDDCLVYEGAI